MTEPTHHENASNETAQPEPASARKPFVRPTVQDAGGLQDVTLLGGYL